MADFKKNEKYKVQDGLIQDGTVPKSGAIIIIIEDEENPIEQGTGERKILYEMVEGEAPEDGSKHFWTESEMAEKLELVEE